MTISLEHAATASIAMIANDTIVRYLVIAVLPPWGGDSSGLTSVTNGRPDGFSWLVLLASDSGGYDTLCFLSLEKYCLRNLATLGATTTWQ